VDSAVQTQVRGGLLGCGGGGGGGALGVGGCGGALLGCRGVGEVTGEGGREAGGSQVALFRLVISTSLESRLAPKASAPKPFQ